jgi:predicted nucleic acid-binding protein
VLIAEAEDHLRQLEPLAVNAKIQGAGIHDARIAAICLAHGVVDLWSADRDFARFPALNVRNPLVG